MRSITSLTQFTILILCFMGYPTQSQTPNPVITSPQNYIAKGQSVLLDVGDQYLNYRWWVGDGSVILGTEHSYLANAPGTYSVMVAFVDGGYGTASFTLMPLLSDQNKNFIVTNTAVVKSLTDPSVVNFLPVDQVNKHVSYFDGLGRLEQSVDEQSSPSKNDLITPSAYDNIGRENRKYLPVSFNYTGEYQSGIVDTNGNYTGLAQNYSNGASDKIIDDNRPFSETLFEPSPLNRPSQQFGPGQNWKDNNKSVNSRYQVNNANEIILFSYDASTQLISATSNSQTQYYGASQLYSHGTTDENGNDVVEYVDKIGHTVCKKVQYGTDTGGNKLYASTYYIYDTRGNLVVVLPPEATRNFDLK